MVHAGLSTLAILYGRDLANAAHHANTFRPAAHAPAARSARSGQAVAACHLCLHLNGLVADESCLPRAARRADPHIVRLPPQRRTLPHFSASTLPYSTDRHRCGSTVDFTMGSAHSHQRRAVLQDDEHALPPAAQDYPGATLAKGSFKIKG